MFFVRQCELTYLNHSTTIEMMPVTDMTTARTQKRPRHLVRSTYEEKNQSMFDSADGNITTL